MNMRQSFFTLSGAARSCLALACLGILAGFYVTSATPAPSSKFYSATRIAPGSGNIPAGETSPVEVRITNCAGTLCVSGSNTYVSTQSLGSANITFPSLFGLGSPSVSAPPGKTWTASVAGDTVQLRTPGSTHAIVPGESVSVTVNVTVPASAACTGASPHTITTSARQSNNFSGPPGNAFTNALGDPTLGISPGALDHFVVGAISSPKTAGGPPITVQATAYDACGTIKTNYAGGAVVTGNLTTSPGFPPGTPGTAPSYGAFGTWTAGTATASVTPYAATSFSFASNIATYNPDFRVTVSHGTAAGQSNFFAVVPAGAAVMTFTQEPTRSYVGAVINGTLVSPGVKVRVQDAYGNLKPGASVGIAIGTNPPDPDGVLAGTTTKIVQGDGIATFDDLTIDQAGLGYTLVATSGAASGTSDAFIVLTTTANCPPCSGSVSIPSTSTLDASALGFQNGDTLGLALLTNAAPPAGACLGFTPAPEMPASYVDVAASSGGPPGATPSLTVSWRIDKSIVDAQDDSGAAHWNICLGAVDLQHPDGVGATPWTQKDGSDSVPFFDSVFNVVRFWGILGNVPGGTASCSALPPGSDPAILSRNKEPGGDVVIVFCVPYPWDPMGITG
jgi:hypothetical protein